MCGIAAISLSPSSTIPIRQLAHELLLHSEERGKVASGFAFHYAGENKYIKAPKPGGHLSLKHLPKDARTVIAHTRNATYGNPEENDNNHPVVDDKEEIMLVHNGVITNHDAIRAGEQDVLFPEVDSSVLPWLIRSEGVKGLQHVDGWAAVAWLDTMQPGVLNLARVQGQAPMVVVFLEDGSTVMGSTFPIIHASLIRIGYGDKITGGYEVPDLTHLEVKAGKIGYLSNIPKYTQFNAKYKGKTMTHAEKQRLEKITNGDAVSYDEKNPAHAPKNSTYTPSNGTTPSKTSPPSTASLVGAGVSPNYSSPYGNSSKPYAGATVSQTSTYSPPDTKPERKPGEDPMAAFDRIAAEKPKTVAVSYGSPGSSYLSRRPIVAYLERRLRYWVEWVDTPGEYDEDIFIASDFEYDGYLYNSFVDLCIEMSNRNMVKSFGVLDREGVRRWSHDLKTLDEEVKAFRQIAEKLPARPERKRPKAETPLGDVARERLAEEETINSVFLARDEARELPNEEDLVVGDPIEMADGSQGVLTASGPKPMFELSDDEWSGMFFATPGED